ncbi:hypothetical protein KLM53_16730 [Clostridioides difficile]|nr:hypothetical protein [Clostridioides difficile]
MDEKKSKLKILYVDEELHALLKSESSRNRMSMQEFVKYVFEQYFNESVQSKYSLDREYNQREVITNSDNKDSDIEKSNLKIEETKNLNDVNYNKDIEIKKLNDDTVEEVKEEVVEDDVVALYAPF